MKDNEILEQIEIAISDFDPTPQPGTLAAVKALIAHAQATEKRVSDLQFLQKQAYEHLLSGSWHTRDCYQSLSKDRCVCGLGPALEILRQSDTQQMRERRYILSELEREIQALRGIIQRQVNGEKKPSHTVRTLTPRDDTPIPASISSMEKVQARVTACELCISEMNDRLKAIEELARPRKSVVGNPGERDPDSPCDVFEPGDPAGDCMGDGHYLCCECEKQDPEALKDREDDAIDPLRDIETKEDTLDYFDSDVLSGPDLAHDLEDDDG